jgi:hypothetical protein
MRNKGGGKIVNALYLAPIVMIADLLSPNLAANSKTCFSVYAQIHSIEFASFNRISKVRLTLCSSWRCTNILVLLTI